MTRVLVLVCVLALLPVSASGVFCELDIWPSPNGTLPPGLISTGDPSDGGSFSVQEHVLVHDSSGSAHYVTHNCPHEEDMVASIDFCVEGTNWEVAWEITADDPSSGRCLRLSHGQQEDGTWAYTFSEFEWWIPAGTSPPGTAYTWHNGTSVSEVVAPTDGPLVGWNYVNIWYLMWPRRIRVTVGFDPIFEELHQCIPGAHSMGLGCRATDAGSPAFEFLSLSYISPVEETTWGRVKALYGNAVSPD
jgi:hypothetical protein